MILHNIISLAIEALLKSIDFIYIKAHFHAMILMSVCIAPRLPRERLSHNLQKNEKDFFQL